MTAVRLYPHFECVDCIERKKQAERGCEQDAPFPYWTDSDGLSRSRCPRRPIYENPQWYNEIIAAYNHYKNGFLPHAGGLVDQPALYPFVMGSIDAIIRMCDEVDNKNPSEGNLLKQKPR